MAYMYLQKRAHVIVTEDSDLLAFGVRKVLFKMDKQGNGIEVDLDRLADVEELNFKPFSSDMLLTTCKHILFIENVIGILSGCDYLDSIKGIGFKKAHRLVHECGDDVQGILKKIRREGK